MNRASFALRSMTGRRGLRRGLAGAAGGGEGKGMMNVLIAGTLLTGVAGIYWTAMSKMRQQDELTELIDAEDAKNKS